MSEAGNIRPGLAWQTQDRPEACCCWMYCEWDFVSFLHHFWCLGSSCLRIENQFSKATMPRF